MKPVIELDAVTFCYGRTTVLEDVSLQIHERDFLSIVGPNGGGKTTILKLILGLARPNRGKVTVFGTSPENARTRIGYMPQHTSLDPLFPVTVIDVVIMGRLGTGTLMGRYTRPDRQAAEEALRAVDLYEVRNRPFADLSGGQTQRVLIARSLVSHPQLLLLDEPTANVDVAAENELYEFLTQLNKSMTIVLVTHDLGFVSRHVKSVACVNRRLLCHPTCDITGDMINEIYGTNVQMIRHDHDMSRKKGKLHD